MPLHDDTLAFLERRNAFRDALAEALLTRPEEPEEPDEPEDPEEPEEPGEGGEGVCTVPGRVGADGKPDTSCNPFAAIAQIEAIECFRDATGWPNCDQLYQDLMESLRSENPAETAEIQIPLQLQVNVMESYRKMLLHKKQRLCHHLSAWCACLRREAQSQSELESLMLNRPIGRTTGTDA